MQPQQQQPEQQQQQLTLQFGRVIKLVIAVLVFCNYAIPCTHRVHADFVIAFNKAPNYLLVNSIHAQQKTFALNFMIKILEVIRNIYVKLRLKAHIILI